MGKPQRLEAYHLAGLPARFDAPKQRCINVSTIGSDIAYRYHVLTSSTDITFRDHIPAVPAPQPATTSRQPADIHHTPFGAGAWHIGMMCQASQ